jgi:hypothetical protein
MCHLIKNYFQYKKPMLKLSVLCLCPLTWINLFYNILWYDNKYLNLWRCGHTETCSWVWIGESIFYFVSLCVTYIYGSNCVYKLSMLNCQLIEVCCYIAKNNISISRFVALVFCGVGKCFFFFCDSYPITSCCSTCYGHWREFPFC